MSLRTLSRKQGDKVLLREYSVSGGVSPFGLCMLTGRMKKQSVETSKEDRLIFTQGVTIQDPEKN